jgi:nitrile hydratase accessory protein
LNPPEPRAFAEPWQAQAFALTVDLHARGAFSWTEWAAALSRERAAASDDGGAGYYASWLAALEALVLEKGLAAKPDLETRAEDWRRAYAATPHGKPVELSNPPPRSGGGGPRSGGGGG